MVSLFYQSKTTMARTPQEQLEYNEIGRHRIEDRQEKRKRNWTLRVKRYGRGSEKCPYCDNYMTWCSLCEVWSSNCCQDYGTCQCS